MGLNKNTLTTQIKAAFKKAQATPAGDPEKSAETQEQILQQLSFDLATAIDAYVRSGDVTGIKIKLDNSTQTGTQTNQGKIQ
jgi:hypothetical protein